MVCRGQRAEGRGQSAESRAEKRRVMGEGREEHPRSLDTCPAPGPRRRLLWGATAGNAVGGIIILSSAKLMMTDTFGVTMPSMVDGAFAAGYVSALSLANMSGRLGWATVSDIIGRQPTMLAFAVLGAPVCLAVPQLTSMAVADPTAIAPLAGFYGGTMLLITMYGGVYALLPAYAADIFGQKHVTAIFGRLMTAAPVAALTGPVLLALLRAQSHSQHARQLAESIDPAEFEATFGAPVTELDALLETKVANIQLLLQLTPPGTVDPTPFLYDSTMYTAAGIITAAGVCTMMIRAPGPEPK